MMRPCNHSPSAAALTFMTTPVSRRRFLQSSIVASSLAASWANAQSPIVRGGPARFSPALNAYSFLELLNANKADASQGIDLFGVVDFCVQHAIDGVDLTGYFFPGYPTAPDRSYIAKLKRYVHDRGITITGTGIKNDFATKDQTIRDEGIRLTKEWIQVAAQLGAPVIRVFAGPTVTKSDDWQTAAGTNDRQVVEAWMADALRECAIHGQREGVLVAVQNHGDFLRSGPEHLSLLKRVDHPWCGALVDTGKYLTDDPYSDIVMMVPHAVNWQIKETLGSSLKSPPADFSKLVRILHEGGYRGFVPIETLSMGRKDYDPRAEIIKVLAELRRAIATLPE